MRNDIKSSVAWETPRVPPVKSIGWLIAMRFVVHDVKKNEDVELLHDDILVEWRT